MLLFLVIAAHICFATQIWARQGDSDEADCSEGSESCELSDLVVVCERARVLKGKAPVRIDRQEET